MGKLSSLAKDKLYAEQKWVTGYLKSARNEADKESAVMQKFLSEKLLGWLQQVDTSLMDQASTLNRLQQNINTAFTAILTDRTNFLTGQRKMLLTANNKVQALGQLQLAELATIAAREEKVKRSESEFGSRFKEAKRKIDGLLSSLLSEYELYSTLVNKESFNYHLVIYLANLLSIYLRGLTAVHFVSNRKWLNWDVILTGGFRLPRARSGVWRLPAPAPTRPPRW